VLRCWEFVAFNEFVVEEIEHKELRWTLFDASNVSGVEDPQLIAAVDGHPEHRCDFVTVGAMR
jgi:hypothetical protein